MAPGLEAKCQKDEGHHSRFCEYKVHAYFCSLTMSGNFPAFSAASEDCTRAALLQAKRQGEGGEVLGQKAVWADLGSVDSHRTAHPTRTYTAQSRPRPPPSLPLSDFHQTFLQGSAPFPTEQSESPDRDTTPHCARGGMTEGRGGRGWQCA